MLRGAAGIGAAGLAAGVLAGAVAGPAGASTTKESAASDAAVSRKDPMVAYVYDVKAGHVDIYHGENHTRVTDHDLAARISRAAG